MENTKFLIIYHKEDNDGIFSLSITYNFLSHENHINPNNISYWGVDYNELNALSDKEFEDMCNNTDYLIMCDVTFNNLKRMVQLKKHFGSKFVWNDHHAPVILESFKLKFDDVQGIRNTERSALLNTYKYFYDPLDINYGDKTVPEILRILSAYDSWSFEREGYDKEYVNIINKAVNFKLNLDPELAIKYCEDVLYNNLNEINELYNIGSLLFEYDKKNYYNLVKNFGDCNWRIKSLKDENNYRSACVLFHQGPSNSLMFEYYKDYVDNGVVFKRLNGDMWVMSLYNTNDEDDFHCGKYCKEKYKGGGHKGAAGCQITQKQMLKILKTKEI